MTALPLPAPGRFKPLRAGLVDLFLYEAQEFRFRDGRLLLRGDNGSGKSKVMALTLPLLLDANLAPARMEPDADPKKQMAWNLLQDGEYEERTGYSWVEFGRLDEAGRQRIVTLGLGVKAVQPNRIAKQWWFLTDRRVGEDLHLVDRLRTVLTRERLIEAVGDRGTVFDTAERYRRAVDEALFSLHDRYGALVDLLVHLRQPQLSKRPDERELARALSESLSPISAALVGVVAESYQALDDDEREVGRLRAGAQAVQAFAGEYRRYARIATARATLGPRQAQSEYERSNRAVAEATAAVDAAAAEQEAADALVRERSGALTALEAQREALRERLGSDELRQLDAARIAATAAAEAAATSVAAEGRARTAAQVAEHEADEAARDVEEAAAGLEHTLTVLQQHAAEAGVALDLGVLRDADLTAVESLGRTAEAEVERRRRQVADLDRLVHLRDAAARARASVQGRLDEGVARRDRAQAEAAAAADTADELGRSWVEAVRAHLLAAVELGSSGLPGVLDAAEQWVADAVGENPVPAWARAAHAAAQAALAAQRADAEGAARALEPRTSVLDGEIEELAAGRTVAPPVPHTRTAARTGPGAPFWACLDPAPDVPSEVAAGIEAALEAAGLLDAWVSGEGSLLDTRGDTLLAPAPVDGPTLAEHLIPMPPAGSGVAAGAVGALLASIGVTAAPQAGGVAVSVDGRFALGPLVGAHHKPAAQYLGATAREHARRQRLAAARAEREDLHRLRQEHLAAAGRLAQRLAVLDGELSGIPSDGPLLRGRDRAALLADRVVEAQGEVTRIAGDLDRALAAERAASGAVGEAADAYRLDPADLEPVRRALAELRLALADLLHRARARLHAVERAAARRRAAETATESLRIASLDARTARDHATRATARLATLESTVGVEARELQARLQAVDEQRAATTTALDAARSAQAEAAKRLAVLEDRLRLAEAAADAAAGERVAAAAGFEHFAATGFLALVAPEVESPTGSPWPPDPTVRAARAVAAALDPAVDDDAWDRAGSRVLTAFEALQSALSAQGTQAIREQRAGCVIVEIQQGGRTVVPTALAEELADALAERERLLTERERAILQTHLIDEVGAELQARVQEAMLQVERMNRELEKRRTRSGVQLRLVWQSVDEEQGGASRRLLQRSAAAWTPADRDAIGAFLADRIEQEREADPDGTWHERLVRAFDYRAWNRFSVQIHQNGRWRPASGPASGGERVLAASVPLFAAAASHYASAGNPHAPRLILLDEAFAGVDDRSRANYLGLLAEFDLDVMMTSEREWATYPEVPGIAIAQLFRLPGTNAVHVDHWEWDGVVRSRVDDPGPTAMAVADRPDDLVALDFGGPPA